MPTKKKNNNVRSPHKGWAVILGLIIIAFGIVILSTLQNLTIAEIFGIILIMIGIKHLFLGGHHCCC